MSSLFLYVDSVDALKNEYESRLRRNKTYSMRAFARDVGASPSTLSEFFAHKHGISAKSAEKIATKLYATKDEREYFIHLVRLKNAQTESSKVKLKNNLLEIKNKRKVNVSLKDFSLIKNWYSLPLLELAKLKIKITKEKCAHYLGVLPEEITKICLQLKKLNLLTEQEDGTLCSENDVVVGDDISSADIKHFHFQMLEKAHASLFHDPVDEREFSNNIVAINSDDLPEIKKFILEMRREFVRKFEASENKNNVCTLSIQFFSLLKDKIL